MMLPIAVAQTAAAQSRSACVARSGGVDLCERARAIEREVAPQLPAKVHPNATFQSVSAVGPRIVVTGILHAGRRGDPALLKLRAIMSGVTRSLLCRQEPTAGFVRQGGDSLRLSARGWLDGLHRHLEGVPLRPASGSDLPAQPPYAGSHRLPHSHPIAPTVAKPSHRPGLVNGTRRFAQTGSKCRFFVLPPFDRSRSIFSQVVRRRSSARSNPQHLGATNRVGGGCHDNHKDHRNNHCSLRSPDHVRARRRHRAEGADQEGRATPRRRATSPSAAGSRATIISAAFRRPTAARASSPMSSRAAKCIRISSSTPASGAGAPSCRPIRPANSTSTAVSARPSGLWPSISASCTTGIRARHSSSSTRRARSC